MKVILFLMTVSSSACAERLGEDYSKYQSDIILLGIYFSGMFILSVGPLSQWIKEAPVTALICFIVGGIMLITF